MGKSFNHVLASLNYGNFRVLTHSCSRNTKQYLISTSLTKKCHNVIHLFLSKGKEMLHHQSTGTCLGLKQKS